MVGRQADHNQGLAAREHATQGAGTRTAVVGKADAVVHRLSKFQHQRIETRREKESLHSLWRARVSSIIRSNIVRAFTKLSFIDTRSATGKEMELLVPKDLIYR